MSVAVLCLFGAFILAVAVRTLILWRATGTTGHRLPPSGAGAASLVIHLFMALGVLATSVAAPLAEMAGLPALPLLDQPWLRLFGVVLAGLGVLGTFAAQLAMGNAWRVGVSDGEHTELVTTGPFRLVRNPIFTAVVTAFAGMALAVPNVIALAGLGAFTLGVQLQVRRVEEPHLRRQHGQAYERYAADVGRFVPGIGRLRTQPR
ncbi:isoprenylcysteine carboxylmethyltransferase family protein [Allosaccharopolyspora coralli]|uniref:Isoprenylcysteine carboxylmethyltransferase family protein n=1 Tax=Allosaccharopolyspora coralli TaxID=2665642 RepID=A0A5Q3QHG9_9PSEU|nr:isoprenylcysteine carboxylmethyltransferase family protein [Allosaccharopolyspora coralli]QGK70277.1 isoprenylcysteine carboxylmethyltransferase family protein [Allosaccharopolyspora coralli]